MRAKRDFSMIVVEDDLAHSNAIKRSLVNIENECSIHFAASLNEFNQLVSKITPEIVLADINLPDGNFISMLDNLELQPWPIVVMTSFGDEQLAVRAIKSGVMDYIVKTPETFRNIEHVISRNIREWHHIQKAKESDNKFRSLFNTMGQGVIYLNSNYKVIDANYAAQKILNISLEEMKNWKTFSPPWKVIREDGSVIPEDSLPINKALRSGKSVENQIIGLENRKNKNEFTWLLVTSIPQYRINENKPFQVFSTFTDITELKKAKEELQNNYNELEKAKEKAEESDRFKTTFIANISHEIRTPLSGILGFAELLRNRGISGELHSTYLDTIVSSANRMLAIVNDLIDISKIETGLIEIKNESTDINKLLDELYIFFLPEAKRKKIGLKIINELPPGVFIETDKTKLSQIISNLLKNALKFTTNGGIEFGSRRKNGECLFFVKDTGPGIGKEYQELIFERFQQGERKTGTKEGAGLGLAISRAYVHALGGKIYLESEPSKGSVFSFTVPYKEIKKNEAPESKQIEDKEAGKVIPNEILIAEDEEFIYFFLNEFLKRYKMNTFHANNGLEAVNIIKSGRKFSIILMDVRMPEMNGLEATREIKKIRPDIPIIALSAHANRDEIEEALNAGCADYITKPIDFKELLNKINSFAVHF